MNILIYDELPLFIYGLQCHWADTAPSNQVFPAHSEEAIWLRIIEQLPDIIVIDAEYDTEAKLLLLARIKSHLREIPVLISVRRIDSINLIAFLEKGAAGVVLKQIGSEELLLAIDWVNRGRIYLPGNYTVDERMMETRNTLSALSILSPRQREILNLVVQGNSNKQICRRLGIAEGTVKNHLHALFRQLGVRNRTEAAMKLAQTHN